MNEPESIDTPLENAFAPVHEAAMKLSPAQSATDRGRPSIAPGAEGHQMIRDAFARAPRLHELLPNLAAKLRAGGSLADEGHAIAAEIAAARRLLREQANPDCHCLADSKEPYPWSLDQYDLLASRSETSYAMTYATIRCRQCGRCYDVEEDSTPATHSICRWLRAPEPAIAG